MMNFPFGASLPGPVVQLIDENLVNMDHTAHMVAEGNGHDEMDQECY